MRTSKNLLTLAFLALALSTAAQAETVEEARVQANQAYIKGDLELARKKFTRVLELEPGDQTAARYVKRIDAEVKALQAGKAPPSIAETRVKKVTLPSVELREASLAEALEFVKQKCNQILGPDQPLNIVLILGEEAKGRKVTLTLKNVPASEVFRYVAQQGNVEISYDQYSMIVKERTATRPAKPGAGVNPPNDGLAEMVLPKLELKEATLAEALEFLRAKTRMLSQEKVIPNFVLQLDDATKATPVTLNLKQVPLPEVLRYVGELAKVEFHYEQYAIVVKPQRVASTASAETSAQ